MFKHFSITRLGREITKIWPFIQVFLVSGLIIFFGFVLSQLLPPIITFTQKMLIKPASLISFTKNPQDILKNTNDRTNFLLLGMRGEGEGALLTDTMLVVSYHYPSHKLSLISLPRDLWVKSLQAKINSAYYYGDQKQPGGGLDLAKSAVSEITDLPIHYGFSINFAGFKRAIDLVGGVDINVDATFDDYKYPIPGLENALPESTRYEHLHFDAGLQHMDGERALKFVRSRNAEGDEGTDFARNARQQKVILAFKDKIVQDKTFLDQTKISQLADIFHQYIVTDIQSDVYGALAKVFLQGTSNSIKSITLSIGNEKTNELGILENPKNKTPYQGQYVLIARDNNWEALHQYIKNELAQ